VTDALDFLRDGGEMGALMRGPLRLDRLGARPPARLAAVAAQRRSLMLSTPGTLCTSGGVPSRLALMKRFASWRPSNVVTGLGEVVGAEFTQSPDIQENRFHRFDADRKTGRQELLDNNEALETLELGASRPTSCLGDAILHGDPIGHQRMLPRIPGRPAIGSIASDRAGKTASTK